VVLSLWPLAASIGGLEALFLILEDKCKSKNHNNRATGEENETFANLEKI